MIDTSLEFLFSQSTIGQVTNNALDPTKPLVVRGIVKRKEMHHCLKVGRDFYYIDTGYFGNFPCPGNPPGKKFFHRIVKNDLQHTKLRDCPKDRWDNLLKHDPRLQWKGWKKSGKNILIITPNPKSCHYYGFEKDQWLESVLKNLKEHTDRPIVIREKGSRSDRNTVDTIYDALDRDVYATVTFNSIAAIESVAYGIPTFVAVPCAASPLAEMDLSKINTPFFPDDKLILQQCRSLAYGQFTGDEITSGRAWAILKDIS